MKLQDIVERAPSPIPWAEGDNIPWNDPAFSERMLGEHLAQEHDMASRRFAKIDVQVRWIHDHLLGGRPTRILDLGCGPGLYASRLARLGHECVGIDFSPASIDYARAEAESEGLACTYVHQDLRAADCGEGFGLAMLLFGEFNVFRPADARAILRKAYRALDGGGQLLLEPHTYDVVRKIGEEPAKWFSAQEGLFSSEPHLCLMENCWDSETDTATIRYYVVDAVTGEVTRYAQTFQAYDEARYRSVLIECGYERVEFLPSLTGAGGGVEEGLFALVAHKEDQNAAPAKE